MALDVRAAETVLNSLFEHATEKTAELMDVAHKINDDAIDVRQFLKSSLEGTTHEKTKDLIQGIADNYEKALTLLSACAGNINTLIEVFDSTKYGEKLDLARSRTGPGQIDREALNKLIEAMAQMNARMMSRRSLWSGFLINFTNLVHGFASAQALLLARPSWFERYQEVLKEGTSMAVEGAVPGFGFLVAFAKSQEPDLYKLIDKMQQATNMLDNLHSFEGILLYQIGLGDYVQALIRQSAANELESIEEFEAAFGRYIS